MSVLRSIRSLIVGTTETVEKGVSMLSTGMDAGKEAVEAWKQDREENLLASAYARRLDLLQRVREDAKRAQEQGLDPRKVMGLTFSDCLEEAVKNLKSNKLQFEPLD